MAEQEFSDGQIGQIRDSVLYDRALTEAEIAALKSPGSTSLAQRWSIGGREQPS